MAITFAVRGDSVNARYTGGWKTPAQYGTVSVDADAGAIGGSLINLDQGAFGQRALGFPARGALPTGQQMSILIRVKAGDTTNALNLFYVGGICSNWGNQARFNAGASLVSTFAQTPAGNSLVTQTYAWAYSANVWYDLVYLIDGTLTTGAVKLYVDGTLVATSNFSATRAALADATSGNINIGMQQTNTTNQTRVKVGEFVIWDTIIDPTNVQLTSGAGSLNGASRTAFVDVSAFEGLAYSDPGLANVKTGVGYTYQGLSITGTYDGSDRWSTLTAAQVKTGVGFTANNVSLTGSYDGSDRWSDPGVANVLSGTSYLVNGTTSTGTYHDPTYSDPGIGNVVSGVNYIYNDLTLTGIFSAPSPVVVSSTLDLGALKDNIKTALDANNVAVGAAVGDLSENMSKRVVKVCTISPEEIMPSANLMPAVCIFIPSKTPKPEAINITQAQVKRSAKVQVTIAGLVWNQNFQGNIYDDIAARDLEYLMENIERVLRGYSELSYAKWHFPSQVTYHNAALDEQTHFKVGFIDVEFTFYY